MSGLSLGPGFALAGTTPVGAAGGDLAGTYPNPTIKSSVALTTPDIGAATGTSLNLSGGVTAGTAFTAGATSFFRWSTTRAKLLSPADGRIRLSNAGETGFDLLQFGGTANTFPALKRSTTTLQVRLADDSAFTFLQGNLQTGVAATTGLAAGALAATTNASIVLYDSTGQAYRVPCII